MKKGLRNVTAGVLCGLVSLLPLKANAQINANLEGINSFEEGKSYFRPNLFYNLPGDIKGFTFGEFYQNGNHFVKTNLTRNIDENFGVKAQIVAGSGFNNHAGIGLTANVPTPSKTFAQVYFIPAYIDMKAKRVDDKSILGYFVSVDLPLGFKASSFGDINLRGKNGAEWSYGELGLEKEILKNLSLSYNPALKNKEVGKVTPRLEQRVTAKYTF